MQVPPEIVLRDIEMTPDIDKLLTNGIARLEKACDYIISTHIAIEQMQGRHKTGNPYRMRIDIRIPDRADIVVDRLSKASKVMKDGIEVSEEEAESPRPPGRSPVSTRRMREEPIQALIRRTFDSALRELRKIMDKQRGEVKTPAYQQMSAVVEKIFREPEYGFLRAMDGQQVYFHRNSLLHKHWENLRVGTIVRYTPELGEKGLQASTVEPAEKPGAMEMHDQLHELPRAS